MDDNSDDDVEIIQVTKKPRREEPPPPPPPLDDDETDEEDGEKWGDAEDISHFVTVYDVESSTEHLEEKSIGSGSNVSMTESPAQPMDNPSIPNNCLHQFCFVCILQWSQLTRGHPSCPMCKKAFNSLIHSMKSSKEFRVHYIEEYKPPTTNKPSTNASSSSSSSSSSSFNRNPNITTAFKTRVDHSNALRNDMYSDVYVLRRAVYSKKLKAIPQSFHTISQTPQLLQHMITPTLLHKLKPWITRELTALLELTDVSVLTELVLSLLKNNIQSPMARNSLQEYIGGNVDIFIHELLCFACSSHKDIASYDKYVRYDKANTVELVE